MTKATSPVPPGLHDITPYLVVRDAAKALEFYKTALGAEELHRMPTPGGKIMHAAVRIGDSTLFVADENAMPGALGPKSIGGTPVSSQPARRIRLSR